MQHAAASLAYLLAVVLAAGCGGDDESEAGQASFVGVPWVLSSGLDVDGWEAVRPSATFADDTVGGSTGCNRYTAPYTVDGDAMELGVVASTRMACPPPADGVERAYVDALGRVAEWRQEDAELVLLDDDGSELLRFAEATPVGDWEVAAFLSGNAVSSPLPGTQLTASFAADGTLTGSGGCNTYRTAFTTDRGGIEIDPPAATRKACAAPEGVMEQEAAYLAALPAAVSYRVDGNSLALLTADGTYVASFVRAP
jgi:heat shock protein HslJ